MRRYSCWQKRRKGGGKNFWVGVSTLKAHNNRRGEIRAKMYVNGMHKKETKSKRLMAERGQNL